MIDKKLETILKDAYSKAFKRKNANPNEDKAFNMLLENTFHKKEINFSKSNIKKPTNLTRGIESKIKTSKTLLEYLEKNKKTITIISNAGVHKFTTKEADEKYSFLDYIQGASEFVSSNEIIEKSVQTPNSWIESIVMFYNILDEKAVYQIALFIQKALDMGIKTDIVLNYKTREILNYIDTNSENYRIVFSTAERAFNHFNIIFNMRKSYKYITKEIKHQGNDTYLIKYDTRSLIYVAIEDNTKENKKYIDKFITHHKSRIEYILNHDNDRHNAYITKATTDKTLFSDNIASLFKNLASGKYEQYDKLEEDRDKLLIRLNTYRITKKTDTTLFNCIAWILFANQKIKIKNNQNNKPSIFNEDALEIFHKLDDNGEIWNSIKRIETYFKENENIPIILQEELPDVLFDIHYRKEYSSGECLSSIFFEIPFPGKTELLQNALERIATNESYWERLSKHLDWKGDKAIKNRGDAMKAMQICLPSLAKRFSIPELIPEEDPSKDINIRKKIYSSINKEKLNLKETDLLAMINSIKDEELNSFE